MQEVLNILWDWNGTLLNDVDVNIKALNKVLERRGVTKLSEIEYKNEFGFPVVDFYKKLGIELSDAAFDDMADEFLEAYLSEFRTVHLHDGIIDALKFFKHQGVMQYILSAMHINDLKNTLYSKGISHYFNRIVGLQKRTAESKVQIGRQLMERERMKPGKTMLIGDTVHDAEVAYELGCQVVLISKGHNNHQRLKNTGAEVYSAIRDLVKQYSLNYSYM